MTQEKKKQQSVAIIGAGAAGLTALFELLHTKKDGSTSLKYNADGSFDSANSVNDDPAFGEIVLFEQAGKVGGVWNPSFDTPDFIPQDIFDTERYDDPSVLRPKTEVPAEFTGQSFEQPLEKTIDSTTKSPIRWDRSAIYKSLYSNVTRRHLRNSFIPFKESTGEKESPIGPFLTNFEVTDNILKFVKTHSLDQYVRTQSEVVDVSKASDNDQWVVTIRQTNDKDKTESWYSQNFDNVIVSSGHYSIPHIPRIEGLSIWNKAFPNSILHSKSFRDESIFKDKRVLFVGTGLSGLDILQYAFPLAKEVITARTPGKKEIYDWLNTAAVSKDIVAKPRVSSVDYANGKTVHFVDGTKIEDVDIIVFSTGYHWHYPFLNEKDTGISVGADEEEGKVPNNNSLVTGIYKSIFSVKDLSLAFVGVLTTQFKWPSFEVASSIIAAVWTGKSQLPSLEEREAWAKERKQVRGSNLLVHVYLNGEFAEFVRENHTLLPKDRNIKNIFDDEYVGEEIASQKVAERLFYELKDGSISIHDTL
ncbi:uncharacterized protein KLLA0_B14619g [Kluyveromyces lactis]|uniref:KLLA0B14619p n=1 Tax=Kluyveromyces lactis (strain ATCC 8585 / CBS 2359 / DSM 70799 / NBRC 1267 / NRRL Y-1140 / WM37) TaxID=284590 RepID=Q6CV57_KLULA|nr:uncharacterized protein KLLA0_B14619g [Kluyveromyces lactis]CAH02575.1 KLLA0B14619p [Kluyveromyces lactis]|eukprot:XP_452182.1 uncharacterized protein KLLA0_B14619g [Kluyveromyces lactis]